MKLQWSGKVGFTCDNVVNYEVVLASGYAHLMPPADSLNDVELTHRRDIINANKTENADLWKALKGGASNFGIVTRFNIQAFYTGDLYGGLITFPNSATDQVISAFSNFTNNIVNYQDGEAFSFWSYIRGSNETVILNDLQDVTGAVDAPAFAEFKAIEPVLSSTLRTDTHLNMAVELNFAKGFRYVPTMSRAILGNSPRPLMIADFKPTDRNVWFAITVKNDPSLLKFIVDQHNAFIPAWQDATGDDTFRLYMIFQSFSTIFFDHGVQNGGNVLGMDSVKENSVMFEVIFVFDNADLEDQARSSLAALRETVKQESVKRGLDVEYEYLK